MTVQTVLCESIGAKWGHGGLSEAKTKTKTEAKYKKIRGSSGGYQAVIGDSLADSLADS